MALEETLSDFGNALVASAAALIILGWLWSRLGWVAGLVFLICFLGVVGGVMGLKHLAYEMRLPVSATTALGLSEGAPSGHTALAGMVYGGLGAVLVIADRRPAAWIAGVACLAVIAAVAVTRVTLDRHTIGDVIAGLLVAAIGVAVFARALSVQLRDRTAPALAPFMACAVVTIGLLAAGVRLNTLSLL